MITNRRLQNFLEFMSGATEHATVLHRFFRLIYLHVLTPACEFYLQRQSGVPGLALCPRHSLVTGASFNVFRSDVDYAAVFKSEPQAGQIQKILEYYARLQRIFPFIGELEFYTRAEWQRKIELEKQNRQLLNLMQKLRKTVWQMEAFNTSTSNFHKRKAGTALMRMAGYPGQAFEFEKMRLALADGLTTFLQSLLKSCELDNVLPAADKVSMYSGFLQWKFGSGAVTRGELSARMSASCCVLLSAILPDGISGMPDHAALIQELRKHREIHRTFLALCESEYLLCQSVRRAKTEPSSDLDLWLKSLKAEMGPRANLTFSHCEP